MGKRIRIVGTALALALLAGPAVAQAGDADRLQQCLQGYRGSDLERYLGACVGIVSGPCSATDQTTLGISQCLMREHSAWDALLNAWWAPMKARAQADGSWDGLLARQRQWIADRDAQCAAVYNEAGGGSIRVIWAGECQRDLTARRAIEFYMTLGYGG